MTNVPNIFEAGERIIAEEVNENFDTIVDDVASLQTQIDNIVSFDPDAETNDEVTQDLYLYGVVNYDNPDGEVKQVKLNATAIQVKPSNMDIQADDEYIQIIYPTKHALLGYVYWNVSSAEKLYDMTTMDFNVPYKVKTSLYSTSILDFGTEGIVVGMGDEGNTLTLTGGITATITRNSITSQYYIETLFDPNEKVSNIVYVDNDNLALTDLNLFSTILVNASTSRPDITLPSLTYLSEGAYVTISKTDDKPNEVAIKYYGSSTTRATLSSQNDLITFTVVLNSVGDKDWQQTTKLFSTLYQHRTIKTGWTIDYVNGSNIITVSGTKTSGKKIILGDYIDSSNLPANTYVAYFNSGSGDAGTYVMSAVATSTGTDTTPIGKRFRFLRNPNATNTSFYLVSGGSGGGSGYCGAAGTVRGGGNGANGSNTLFCDIKGSDIPYTGIVGVIGYGGAGGASVSTLATNGNDGTTGEDTYFGLSSANYYLKVSSGIAGKGGKNTTNSQSAVSFVMMPATIGANASSTGLAGASATYGFNSGGGAGGGIDTANNVYSGGNGRDRWGSSLSTHGIKYDSTAPDRIVPSESGAGGASTVGNGVSGYDGGDYGGAGGGGGAATFPNVSGAGGRGGDGCILIIQEFQ